MKTTLNPNPVRTDLTSREIAKLLGGFLGGFVEMASIDDIKTAVKFWADTPEAWESLEALKKLMYPASGNTEEAEPKKDEN